MITNMYWSTYPLLLSDFNEIWIIATDFLIIIKHFAKIHAVGAELLHAEGQTDRQEDRHDEVNGLFSRFSNAHKNE